MISFWQVMIILGVLYKWNKGIDNFLNAIKQGIISNLIKESLLFLEQRRFKFLDCKT